MTKLFTAFALLLALTTTGAAQTGAETQATGDATITVDANGDDVRSVLHSIFTEHEKSFVVETGLYFSLFLNLHNVPFDKAIKMICRISLMDYRIEEGIYVFFRPKPGAKPLIGVDNEISSNSTNATKPNPLDPSVLNKTFTTKLENADIRSVVKEISEQTGVPIEVAEGVKNFRINAYLIDTSLRFALNSITRSAKLSYTFTPRGTILIHDPETESPSGVG